MTKMKRIIHFLLTTVLVLGLSGMSWGLTSYNVSHTNICMGVKQGNSIFFTSTLDNHIGEYDTISMQEVRSWGTGVQYPMMLQFNPAGTELTVLLHNDVRPDFTREIGVINLSTGSYTVHNLGAYPLLNLEYDITGNFIYLTAGDQLTNPGKIYKVDTSSWTIVDEADCGNYPQGICYYGPDAIFIATTDTINTWYGEEGEIPGPPYFSNLQRFNDRLDLVSEIAIPYGLNYITEMGPDQILTLHIPAEGNVLICVIDIASGTVDQEISIPECGGIIDAVYSPVTQKIYATVVEVLPHEEDEVPGLEYTGNLLVYDTLLQSYVYLENYFDSQVGFIDIFNGQIVVNSVDSTMIYVESPF